MNQPRELLFVALGIVFFPLAGANQLFAQTPCETGKLLEVDLQDGALFGHAVAIDGDTAIVGASHWGIPFWDPGAAFVFRFDGLDWLLQQNLLSSDGVDGDQFGVAVALDGDTVVVGALGDDPGFETGSAYIFGGLSDCNENGELDLCDIADGFSPDDNNNGIPDECEPPDCPWDLDDDAVVGVPDLLSLLGSWGPCPPKGDCLADFDNTGDVGVKDLLILLGNWGPCP